MTPLEQRLRADLPELADALLAHRATAPRLPTESSELLDALPAPPRRATSILRVLVGAAATVSIVAALMLIGNRLTGRSDPTRIETTNAAAPAHFGTWSPLAEAPIEPRSYAVTAWTGSRAVFWAGSNIARNAAYEDGAMYDPATDSWEEMSVPGWGHPGLTSAFFDGELYALAKGGGTRFDPIAGEWRDLPQVDGMFLAATVASDETIWGLGPAASNVIGQPDLAIARFDPADDTWSYGPVWEPSTEQSAIVSGLSRLESSAVWIGNEVFVCGRTGGCVAFDPSNETWRSIPPASKADAPSVTVVTELGLTMLVQSGDGSTAYVEVLSETGWERRVSELQVGNFETVTTAAAGEWLAIFASEEPPLVVHLPTGAWQVAPDARLAGVQAPNTVWTGGELLVWGGRSDDPSRVGGARWTP
ncbi:MAG: hypothetical protein O3C27_15275, partial [Actinomycetota bacterium]|nr:hypothetical protein [Actinomycetota bacterium]